MRGLTFFLKRVLPLLLCLGTAWADDNGVPLVVGGRTLHVFRANVGPFTPDERMVAARTRVERALNEAGEGWTSVRATPEGALIELDGKPMFYVATGDERSALGETPEGLANQASRLLQKAWTESHERHDPQAVIQASLRVAVALAVLLAAVLAIFKGTRWIRSRIVARLGGRLHGVSGHQLGAKVMAVLAPIASRLPALIAWSLTLLAAFAFLTYSLGQFAFTRAAADSLSESILALFLQVISGVTASVPGIFISILIFMAVSLATRLSTELFTYLAENASDADVINAHTAPVTRRIVNGSLWLFALAMAYPYLPGAQTEAFKGLTVIMGLMVSIGASGLVGQMASGIILVYTRALLLGEYVRIQDCEGTVVDLGLFVTRLRTGVGEEIALPNSLVLANVTRNYSRAGNGQRSMLETSVTIGYDTPWRQVHALLKDAAARVPDLLREPEPFVVQTALNDFYVAYKLVVCIDDARQTPRPLVLSALHAAIQDEFNRHGVQIMSPHYLGDPAQAKVVRPEAWYAPPAKPIDPTGTGAD